MKATTKLQKQVVLLSSKLPPVSPAQKAWAFEHTLEHFGCFTSRTAVCFDCGHTWEQDRTTINISHLCPNCNRQLKERDSKRKFKDSAYYGIVTTKEEFQVLRFFWVEQNCAQKKHSNPWLNEVVQLWINPEGKTTVISRSTNTFSGYYYDNWNWSSKFEIKARHRRHEINPWKWYPRTSVSKCFKRNGFSGKFHHINPLWLLESILTNSKSETLIKAGQFSLLDQNIGGTSIPNKWWPSIKICIRNKYIVENAKDWIDHLELLNYFGKDIRNAHYICPANFNAEHQKLIAKKKIIRDREQHVEDQQRRVIDQEKAKKRAERRANKEQFYQTEKSKFFNLAFTDGTININVLTSVNEFKDEANELLHCVYDNAYYDKKDSLILSAKIEDQRLETIEVSLSKMKLVQARGLENQPSQYHAQIINLMNKNLHQIKKLNLCHSS